MNLPRSPIAGLTRNPNRCPNGSTRKKCSNYQNSSLRALQNLLSFQRVKELATKSQSRHDDNFPKGKFQMLILNAKRTANMLAWGIFAFSLFSEANLTYGQIRPVRFIPLGDAPGGDFKSSASAVSADGRVVVGSGVNDRGTVALRWTEQGGITEIPPAFPEKKYISVAGGVSSDGNTVIGFSSSNESIRGANMSQGFIWTAEKGIRLLGSLPGGFPVLPNQDRPGLWPA